MTSYRLLEHLLALEQRARQIYVLLSQRQHLPEDLRAVWQALAEDETQHMIALERSARKPYRACCARYSSNQRTHRVPDRLGVLAKVGRVWYGYRNYSEGYPDAS